MGPLLRIGCCSWTSEAWWDRIYPRRLKPGERLSWYARLYDAVEVDSTYYAPPARALVEGWRRKTPDGFRFALKFPRDFLDPRKPAEPGELVGFLENAARLGEKLGPVLLQFPPWFKPGRDPSNSPNVAFLERRLAELPSDRRFAVELRDRGWYEGATRSRLLKELSSRRVALCWSSLTYLDVPPEVTADWLYLRFIGDHESVPSDTHGQVRVDRASETKRWADRLATSGLPEAWCFFNNHYEGFAPASLNELRKDLSMPPVDFGRLLGRLDGTR